MSRRPTSTGTSARLRRTCARPGCNALAAATLSYEYASRTVWLEEIHLDDHPANHDLCTTHADRLTPPNGWRLVERRNGRATRGGTPPGTIRSVS